MSVLAELLRLWVLVSASSGRGWHLRWRRDRLVLSVLWIVFVLLHPLFVGRRWLLTQQAIVPTIRH